MSNYLRGRSISQFTRQVATDKTHATYQHRQNTFGHILLPNRPCHTNLQYPKLTQTPPFNSPPDISTYIHMHQPNQNCLTPDPKMLACPLKNPHHSLQLGTHAKTTPQTQNLPTIYPKMPTSTITKTQHKTTSNNTYTTHTKNKPISITTCQATLSNRQSIANHPPEEALCPHPSTHISHHLTLLKPHTQELNITHLLS